MTDEKRFLPEIPLRHLGYHKRVGKSRPPQSLYIHCLNTFYAASTIADLIPLPLNNKEQRILGWAALLHDAGKDRLCWQKSGHGAHMSEETTEIRLREVLTNGKLTGGHGPKSEEETDLIIELVREHHTRRTLSNADKERVMKTLKLADNLVSAQRIDSRLVDLVAKFLQPKHRPVVLSAEQHPLSHYALSIADQEAEKHGYLLVANPLQSLYLIPEGMDTGEFKSRIRSAVVGTLSKTHRSSSRLAEIYSWKSSGPIRKSDAFLQGLHHDREDIAQEIYRDLEAREKQIENQIKKGVEPDERLLWFGPFRILYYATKKITPEATCLMGTNIPMDTIKKAGSPLPDKDIAKEIAEQLGCKSPRDYIERVLDILIENTEAPDERETNIDILRWSDETLDASEVAQEYYEHYRNTQWCSKNRIRDMKKYCFSCKKRPAEFDAPKGEMKTDTWTSAATKKGKVRVCELCFIAQAYVLPQNEPGKFHIDATPAYNQARVDWEKMFWRGAKTPDFKPQRTSMHRLLFPLRRASTPNEALESAFGNYFEFKFETAKEYRTYIDFLFLHGLHGTIGSGPHHPGPFMLTGNGIRIGTDQWESYGKIIRFLYETRLQKVFPARSTWFKLVEEPWGWGTILSTRQRRKKIKEYQVSYVKELIEMKSKEQENSVLSSIITLPLHIADRDERFKSAESVFRRMETVARRAAKNPEAYGETDKEIIERIAQIGKKQLRTRIEKASRHSWRVSNERLVEVDHSLRAAAGELWKLRDEHTARQDFVNAAIMSLAYKPGKEDKN